MASQYIIELGMNDDITNIIRKANANFRNLYLLSRQNKNATNKASNSSSASIEQAVSNGIREINDAVADGINSINSEITKAIDNGVAEADRRLNESQQNYSNLLQEKFNDLSSQLESKAKEITVPPIGTIIICEYNPNVQWPNSTWEQIEIDSIEFETWKRIE